MHSRQDIIIGLRRGNLYERIANRIKSFFCAYHPASTDFKSMVLEGQGISRNTGEYLRRSRSGSNLQNHLFGFTWKNTRCHHG